MSLIDGFYHGLNQLCSEGTVVPARFKVFYGRSTSRMCLRLYLEHVQHYLDLSDEVLGISYTNLLNFLQQNPDFQLSKFTAPRLLLVCIVTVSKYVSDFSFSAERVAMLGCIPTSEYVAAELAFLEGIRWKISVTDMRVALQQLVVCHLQVPTPQSSSDSGWEHMKPEENEFCSELTAFFDMN